MSDPQQPLADAHMEAEVQAGSALIKRGVEAQVVLSAMAMTALRRTDLERDVQQARAALNDNTPEVVLRALVMRVQQRAQVPSTADGVLGPSATPLPAQPAAAPAPPPLGPRYVVNNKTPHPSVPHPDTFGPQNF